MVGLALTIEPFDTISANQIADALGVTHKEFNFFLKGSIQLTSEMAARLSAVLGGSTTLWLNLQRNHDLWLADKFKDVTDLKRFDFEEHDYNEMGEEELLNLVSKKVKEATAAVSATRKKLGTIIDNPENQVFESVWDALEDDPVKAAEMKLRSDLLFKSEEALDELSADTPNVEKLIALAKERLHDVILHSAVKTPTLADLLSKCKPDLDVDNDDMDAWVNAPPVGNEIIEDDCALDKFHYHEAFDRVH